jgi:hypothetical protein
MGVRTLTVRYAKTGAGSIWINAKDVALSKQLSRVESRLRGPILELRRCQTELCSFRISFRTHEGTGLPCLKVSAIM